MLEIAKPFVLSLIRHGLTAAGGALALGMEQTNQLVGSGLFLVGLAWSFLDKFIRSKAGG